MWCVSHFPTYLDAVIVPGDATRVEPPRKADLPPRRIRVVCCVLSLPPDGILLIMLCVDVDGDDDDELMAH